MRIIDCPQCLAHVRQLGKSLEQAIIRTALDRDITIRRAFVGYMSAHHGLGHPTAEEADVIADRLAERLNLDGSLN